MNQSHSQCREAVSGALCSCSFVAVNRGTAEFKSCRHHKACWSNTSYNAQRDAQLTFSTSLGETEGRFYPFQKSQMEKQPWTTEPIWVSNLNSLSKMTPRFLTTEMFFDIKGGKRSINTIIGTLMIATHCDLCLTVI